MKFKALFGVVSGITWGLLGVMPVWAGAVINEVYPNPDENLGEVEWIELYNSEDQTIELNGWQLDDAEGGTNSYKINDVRLLPKTWIVFTKTESKIGLNNDGDSVRLFDPQGQLVDEVTYPKMEKRVSYGRVTDGDQTWQAGNLPTQGSSNSQTAISPTQQGVPRQSVVFRLTEVKACPPNGETEWIEVENISMSDGSLEGWSILDNSDHRQSLEGMVGANTKRQVSWSSSFLNNTGDTVSLVDPNKTTQDSFQYSECDPNLSWSRFGDAWSQTSLTTPGQANQLVAPTLKAVKATTAPTLPPTPMHTQTAESQTETKIEPAANLPPLLETATGSSRTASVSGIIDLASRSGQLAATQAGSLVIPQTSPPWLWIFGGLSLMGLGSWPWLKDNLRPILINAGKRNVA